MPKLMCWLFHVWGKWAPVELKTQKLCADGQLHDSYELWQERQCCRCGYKQRKRL